MKTLRKINKFTINESKWYCRDNPHNPDTQKSSGYDPALLDEGGNQCCLGFYCEQAGVPRSKLLYCTMPNSEGIPMAVKPLSFVVDAALNIKGASDLAKTAANINDSNLPSHERRKKNLVELFAEEGIEIEFINSNKLEQTRRNHEEQEDTNNHA